MSLTFVRKLAAVLIAFGCSMARASTAIPDPSLDESRTKTAGRETTVLAAGCFWGTQAIYKHTRGVIAATAGYTGGTADTAHYSFVSTGSTGHAESVEIVYDPSQISYGQLLKIFFSAAHDPTQLNRQNDDIGTQYRSGIFYTNKQQKHIADAYIQQLNKAKTFAKPVVTQVVSLEKFYPAEANHQDYVSHHPSEDYVVKNELPKLAQFHATFSELWMDPQEGIQSKKGTESTMVKAAGAGVKK